MESLEEEELEEVESCSEEEDAMDDSVDDLVDSEDLVGSEDLEELEDSELSPLLEEEKSEESSIFLMEHEVIPAINNETNRSE